MAEQYVNSIIGYGSFFRGDMEVEGLVRVDGDFLGTVRKASRVLIGSQGRADATIHARVVVIGGAFNGTIYATSRVVVLSSALACGTIHSPQILVEPGAMLGCTISVHGETEEERGNKSFGKSSARREQLAGKTATRAGMSLGSGTR